MTEPRSPAEVGDWLAGWRREHDPFEPVRAASEEHRAGHGPGCTVYPTSSGPLLGAIVAATGARRVLEVGAGLGYSALWLAAGGASVETIERDSEHAELARANVAGAAVSVIEGIASRVLPELSGPYDLLFSDSDPVEMPAVLDHALRLVRPGGTIVSANLFLGQFVTDLPHADRMVEYRRRVVEDERLLTGFAPDGLAVSVLKRG